MEDRVKQLTGLDAIDSLVKKSLTRQLRELGLMAPGAEEHTGGKQQNGSRLDRVESGLLETTRRLEQRMAADSERLEKVPCVWRVQPGLEHVSCCRVRLHRCTTVVCALENGRDP